MTHTIVRFSWGISATFLACLAMATMATGEEEVRWITDVGKAYYNEYCQVCHGADGRGEGPFSNALDSPPPDLTTIAVRRGGVFPSLEVAELIDGTRRVRAHGSSDMPVWGARLREPSTASDKQGSENALRGRVFLLTEYLRSLQLGIEAEVVAGPEEEPVSLIDRIPTLAELGREQYLRRCSACHGPSGRGDGPLHALLSPAPPDLTQIAKRREGKFSSVEIVEIIDGRRDLRAHGSRDMPVWGVELGTNRAGVLGKETAVRGDLHLLVEYLRSIQAY